MKFFQTQGLSIYSLIGMYVAIFTPKEEDPHHNFYVGLVTNDLFVITTNAIEPTAKSYKRAETNGKGWKIELKRLDNHLLLCATNTQPIIFDGVTDDWGVAKGLVIFRSKTTTQFSAYSPFKEPVKITVENPLSRPGFDKECINFAMPLLEEEEGENIISTILKGEKNVMVGMGSKEDGYKGCPLAKPKNCREYKSELRCGLARKDQICLKTTRLSGTGSPGTSAAIGRGIRSNRI